jgi:hypothetical protein
MFIPDPNFSIPDLGSRIPDPTKPSTKRGGGKNQLSYLFLAINFQNCNFFNIEQVEKSIELIGERI